MPAPEVIRASPAVRRFLRLRILAMPVRIGALTGLFLLLIAVGVIH